MSLSSQKKFLDNLFNRSTDRVPFSRYLSGSESTDNIYFFLENNKSYLGFACELGSVVSAGEDIVVMFNHMIKYLPRDSVIQSISVSLPSVGNEVDDWYNARSKYSQEVKDIAGYRADYFKNNILKDKFAGGLQLREKMSLLFFKIPVDDPNNIFGFKDKAGEIINSMKLLNARMLSSKEFTLLMSKLLNANKCISNPSFVNTSYDISHDNLLFRDNSISIKDDHLVLDDGVDAMGVMPLTISEYPNALIPYDIGNLLGDLTVCNSYLRPAYMIYTNIIVGSIDDLSKYKGKELIMGKQVGNAGDFVKSFLPGLLKRHQDIKQYITLVDQEKYVPCRMYTGINVYAPIKGIMDMTQQVITSFARDGFKLEKERYIPLPIFLNSLPFSYRSHLDRGDNKSMLNRSIPTHSWNAASAIITQGGYMRSNPNSGGISLTSRTGGFAPFNIFNLGMDAKNFTILGSTGSGKSFFTNDLVCSAYGDGADVFIFDSGGSYSGLCSTLKGTSIRFDPLNKQSINPFYGVHSDREFVEINDFWVSILVYMLNYKGNADQIDFTLAGRAIRGAWKRKKGDLHMTDIVDEYLILSKVVETDTALIHGFIQNLYDYSDKNGKYYSYFNGKPIIKIDNQFVYLELDDLSSDPILRTLVLSIMSSHIMRKMYKERDKKKLVLFDEAWELLKDPIISPVIEAMYRKMRKYNGAVGLISQNISDVDAKDPNKKVISTAFQNSQIKFYLRQEPQSIDEAEKSEFLGKNPLLYKIMRSIPMASSVHFSELMIQIKENTGILRFYVDSFSYLCFSSTASDVIEIEQEMKRSNVSKVNAIKNLLSKKNV